MTGDTWLMTHDTYHMTGWGSSLALTAYTGVSSGNEIKLYIFLCILKLTGLKLYQYSSTNYLGLVYGH